MTSFEDIKSEHEATYNNLQKEKRRRQNFSINTTDIEILDKPIKGMKMSFFQPSTKRNFVITEPHNYVSVTNNLSFDENLRENKNPQEYFEYRSSKCLKKIPAKFRNNKCGINKGHPQDGCCRGDCCSKNYKKTIKKQETRWEMNDIKKNGYS